jgi:formylglycine-generating enzyme required for sulfatase activity
MTQMARILLVFSVQNRRCISSVFRVLMVGAAVVTSAACTEPFGIRGFLDGEVEEPVPSALHLPGEIQTITAAGLSFDMVYVPGDLVIPTRQDDSETEHVAEPTWMMKTETTYELWYAVREWAENSAPSPYTFARAGSEGKPGSPGLAPTAASDQPAVEISWRDAMIFSNAITEWYNAQTGESLEPVYYVDAAFTTPIRAVTNSTTVTWELGPGPNDGTQDDPYVKTDADGFRLPFMNEWEIAARWKGDLNADGDILDPGEAYPGTYASGATGPYSDAAATHLVSWGPENSFDTTHEVGQKPANALGLHDMSGNVAEFCFDWSPDLPGERRLARGGSYPSNYLVEWLVVADRSRALPYADFESFGVRLVTNAASTK